MKLHAIMTLLAATAAPPAGAQAPDAALAAQVAPLQPPASAISQAQDLRDSGQASLEPPQLVSRSQTPPSAAEPIAGSDRCDPVRLETASTGVREACRHTLERRADEFSRPAAAELSSTERVIASGANAAANGVSASATASGLPIGTLAAGAVAAQTQRPAAPAPTPPAAPQLDPALAAVVAGVLNGIIVQTRP